MSEEVTEKVLRVFCRKTLRRTILLRSSHGKYCVRTKALDRDSLKVHTQENIFLPESMNNLVWMYLSMESNDRAIKPNE